MRITPRGADSTGCRLDGDRVGIAQGGRSADHLDVVAVEVATIRRFRARHGLLLRHEVADGDLMIELQLDPLRSQLRNPRGRAPLRKVSRGASRCWPTPLRGPAPLDQGHRLAEVPASAPRHLFPPPARSR